MSKYTTGELAKLCSVSVRTVQFYDTKGLLPPNALTEGGRRLYTDDDLIKLRLICMLKALGLTLGSIQGILDSEVPGKVLTLLLDEQIKQISSEMKEKQEQIEAIRIVKENIRNMDVIPVHSIHDIGHMMKNKKGLRKVHVTMLGISILANAIEYATIAVWITKGVWIPFAIVMPFVILITALLVKMYYQNTAYICASCNATFKPKVKEFFFAAHTPKTRKLTCGVCGHKGYCVEVYAEKSH